MWSPRELRESLNNSSENVPQTVQSAVDVAKRPVVVKWAIGESLPQTVQSAVHALQTFRGFTALGESPYFSAFDPSTCLEVSVTTVRLLST